MEFILVYGQSHSAKLCKPAHIRSEAPKCVFSSIFTLVACAGQAMPIGKPVAPTTVTAVHGCHGYYSHDMKGWHRHGKSCEAQRGLARNKRDKKRSI